MNVNLICIGKLKERYWQEACAEYGKRLSRFLNLQITELKEERLPDRAGDREEQAVIEAEGRSILRALPEDAFVIALDLRGRSMDSPQLARYLDDLALQGRSRVAFVIGGSLGLSGEVLRRADLRLSFSAFTFPHQLMRVILLEQLYRACKISAGEKYHK
ncbi:MAG: 23S rRNA (pseudouridine(1915)-N(3))-methyltransferase RlmH [Firmicutes bacterium]|nr:23S rRNA (pseudouridine(1915)-N(3))-methyltransferase RlmH [Bacillota bacterium]MBR2783121.1 23S rRNA (pseudouridine(1915)-N(3))-methyltransferase RlmH [Bacillota bacterium]